MLIVAALGGNALLRRGEPLDAQTQRANVERAANALAPLAAKHRLVVTHGNGPQVGLLALQAAAYKAVRSYPLDVLGAESEGMIGYVVEQELRNAAPGLRLATLLTQVEVSPFDPAFAAPTKPVGPVYTKQEAEVIVRERGWMVAPEGEGFRHVVASPRPLRILELDTIRLLVEAGVTVICTGGGGIPVVVDGARIRGVEAVIDKDAASALLAREIGADLLLMLTDVKAVMTDWGTANARAVKTATATALAAYAFAAGSMGPKVEAAISMAAAGKRAAIGALEDAAAIVQGTAGTTVLPDQTGAAIAFWSALEPT
jgi:carbamate kinase